MTLFGDLREGVAIAWEALRANLLRSVLTTVGIVIGIVTVTLMAAAIEWLDRSFAQAVSFLGTDVLYVDRREWSISSQPNWQRAQRRERITPAHARQVERGLSMVAGVAPTAMHSIESVQYGERASGMVTLIGTNDQFLVTGGITMADGRFMTKTEAAANRDICIIGAEIAEKLFLHESPLGKRIRVGDQFMEVIGVVERRGSVMGRMSLDNQVIIPIQKMIRGYRREPSCVIQVKVGDPTRMDDMREELRGLMRKIRRVRPGADDDFAINQQEELLGQFRKVSGIIAIGGFFITGLSLFVGGIGIMNIMFVSVAERTKEIGIRKAIGAKRRTILIQFLIEAAIICLLGGLIGLAFAWGANAALQKYLPTEMSLRVAGLAIAMSLLTGVVAGFFPANRAARMNAVDALRAE